MTFVSGAAYKSGIGNRLDLRRIVEPVRGCRDLTKRDMLHNDALPHIEVNPETYEVRIDGEIATSPPAETLPLTQKFFLI